MKIDVKRIVVALCTIVLAIATPMNVFAHSGRTDSSGGHKDNKNKSGLGSYHYHCGGYPAHLHPNGICPYKGGGTSSNTSSASTSTPVVNSPPSPSSVSIACSKTTLRKGESVSISATVNPNNAYDTSVTWSSSDPSVVGISNGKILAKNFGAAVVTAMAANGVKQTIRITVQEVTAQKVTVSGLPETEDLYVGDTFILSADIEPADVDNPFISWSSSDKRVATVSENGKVQLHTPGDVEIAATASNGVSSSKKFVVKEIKAEKITVDGPNSVLIGNTVTLIPVFIPENTSDKNITWTTSDNEIASVSENGTVEAKGVGTVTIKAVQKDVTSTHTLEILPIEVETISISADKTEEIIKNDEIHFTADIFPENATYKQVDWSVSNSKIATIDEDGTLLALRRGTVTVTATAKNGVSAEYEVKIFSSFSKVLHSLFKGFIK